MNYKLSIFFESFHFILYRSTFSDFAHRYGKDERFRGVEKTRERESLFNEFIVDVRRKEKDERDANREKVHFSFLPPLWAIFYFKVEFSLLASLNGALL